MNEFIRLTEKYDSNKYNNNNNRLTAFVSGQPG